MFADLTQAATYYLCQRYLHYFYQSDDLPLLLRIGFPAWEADLKLTDQTIKTALENIGAPISSFDLLNQQGSYDSGNGLAVAYAFGEFMSVFKNWGYPAITQVNANSFNVFEGWYNIENLAGVLDDFNRYLTARFLEPNEDLRIKMMLETENFRFFTRPTDYAINFPYFSDVLENAFQEYTKNFKVSAAEKFTYFTLPTCVDDELEGHPCNGLPPARLAGGTAWSSGMHSTCATNSGELTQFYHMNRHELAHGIQALMPQGQVTAWLNEGFPQFCASGPITNDKLNELRQSAADAMAAAEKYFGHRPTYEETKQYPNPDYGYYTLGYFLNDFIYRKGGYDALKNVQMGDTDGYQKMGYSSAKQFLDDFYLDFDVRVLRKPVVTLLNPTQGQELTSGPIYFKWIPLNTSLRLSISVSTDDQHSWKDLAAGVTGTGFIWAAEKFSGNFYLRFTVSDNAELKSVFGPFEVADINTTAVNFPNGGEYLIAGDTARVSWRRTIHRLNIQLTTDGKTWIPIASDVDGSLRELRWIVPDTYAQNCKLRVSATDNPSFGDESDQPFEIVRSNPVGGPYLFDENTLLLFHFDNDFTNRSGYSGNLKEPVQNLILDVNSVPGMGKSLKTASAITVPHHKNLNLTGDWTIEAWVKFKSYSAANTFLITKPGDADPYLANYSLSLNPYWGNVFYGFYFSDAQTRVGVQSDRPKLNEWYHVAFIRDTRKSEIRLLVHDKDRKLISQVSQHYEGSATFINTKDLLIASGLTGNLDEIRISNVVRNFDLPMAPYSPRPESSAQGISQVPTLSWTNGPNAGFIDVYLDTINPPAKKVIQNAPELNSFDPGRLRQNTTYYWQVLVRNLDKEISGPVWNFTTGDFTHSKHLSEKKFSVYPNPSSGIFYVIFPDTQKAELRIINSVGQIVKREWTDFDRGQVQFNLKNVPPGAYILQVNQASETSSAIIYIN